jgi:hypothetical protein
MLYREGGVPDHVISTTQKYNRICFRMKEYNENAVVATMVTAAANTAIKGVKMKRF